MKYYQPEKEEFCIGFEFEILDDFDTLDEVKWHKLTYGDRVTDRGEMGCPFPVSSLIRVKCLDSDDIEECGFVDNRVVIDYNTEWYIHEELQPNVYCITLGSPSRNKVLFKGTIKNKSELKKVLKMIGYEG